MRLSLLTLALLVALCGAEDEPLTTEAFDYNEQLDENYKLYWKFNDTHVVFETHTRTQGYVGFGLSPKGAMEHSDVVIGWVKDGKPYFADRHAEGHFLPAKDASQDWHLIQALETGEWTVLKMVRKLDTCDPDDMPIVRDTARVIFSYHPNDPSDEDSIPYHGNMRGTKSILLLDPPTKSKNNKPLPPDTKTIDFLNNNYTVPGKDTMYRCSVWKLPDLGQKHHMIRYEPVIQKGHENLVHHIILYHCAGSIPDMYVGHSFECYTQSPQALDNCYHVFVAWAIGGTAFNYPDHVGHSLGTPQDPGYFKMETHYDNPDMRTDFVDNSGLRIYLTTQLRKYDAGMLETGVNVDAYHIIPPFDSSFLSSGYCHQDCISEGYGDNEVHVFANILHAHLLGAKLRTRHFRNGAELPPISEDNNYNFDYQETRLFKQERTIKKGDSLITECEYNSTGRTSITYGGLSSRQEMCLSFLLYYPRQSFDICLTRIDYKIPRQFAGRNVFDIVQHLDWTQPDVREAFKKDIEESNVINLCMGENGPLKFNGRITPVAKITNPYLPPKTCPK